MVVVSKISYGSVNTGLHLVHVLNSVKSLDLKIDNDITVIIYHYTSVELLLKTKITPCPNISKIENS